ncbi:tRNA (guanosine(46)-N7)-methyltransferase TrmB [Betaproteobacteria bacterium SCN2]|nr:tRNA (guanosine(46)-N7)-methyltransferase TrmB [Betaproteobacteria bacterium SCN2]
MILETPEQDTRPRRIRSYVLRQGRMSEAQRRAYEDALAHWGIAYAPAPLDLAAAFGRNAPTILEIGFGMGRTTAEIAAAHPQNNYLGVEVHTPGVGSLLKEIQTRGLDNIRLIQHDAVEVLTHMLADGTLAGIHIYFPDPWPKKRHHKRRLIQSELVALLVRKLAPGGYLHCATDWEDYALQMLEVLNAEAGLKNTADGFAPRPQWRPVTKFEQRGLKLGHGVWDLLFEKPLSA